MQVFKQTPSYTVVQSYSGLFLIFHKTTLVAAVEKPYRWTLDSGLKAAYCTVHYHSNGLWGKRALTFARKWIKEQFGNDVGCRANDLPYTANIELFERSFFEERYKEKRG